MGDVTYGLREVDYMPTPPKRGGGRGRTSEFSKMIDEVVATKAKHGKPFLLADYGKNEGASAAAQNLRNRYGWQPAHNGWDFKVGRVETDEGLRVGIFGVYSPARIVPGAWEEARVQREEKKAQRALQRSEKVNAPQDREATDEESAIERLMSA